MPIRFDILTLFPKMFDSFAAESIIGKAISEKLIDVWATNIRDFASGRHKITDDYSFGGGCGMVMMAEPIARALEHIKQPVAAGEDANCRIILTSPQGRKYSQHDAIRLASYSQLIIICGHYEGVDERVSSIVDEEISIGDFVLTGGEIPAMAIIDSVARMIPGVLGHEESAPSDSFYEGLLDFPHYTRPRVWRGMEVPPVLISGDHAKIKLFRRAQALKRTAQRRPDLMERIAMSDEDKRLLDDIPKPRKRQNRKPVIENKDS
jgi:tRNA (guanine37-N1)-methyltransferase